MDTIRYPTGPLARAMAILHYVAAQRKSVPVADISAALEMPLPTAHRMVANLESLGYLQRAVGTRRVIAGAALMELGAASLLAGFSMSSTHAVLQRVSASIGEQCEISVVRHGYVEYIANIKAESFVGLQFDAGKQVPLHCTSTGKIYLSTLRDDALKRMVASLPLRRFTPNTITDPDALIREVREVRARQWAKSNEEFVLGVVGCGVPILSEKGTLVASLGVSVASARVSFDKLDAFFPKMREAARELADHILHASG